MDSITISIYADDTQLNLSFKPTPAKQPGSIAKIEACVTSTSKACFFHLRNISKVRDCLSPADTKKLVHAFVTCKLDSANSLLYGLLKVLIDRLYNVQNAAARVITRRNMITSSLS